MTMTLILAILRTLAQQAREVGERSENRDNPLPTFARGQAAAYEHAAMMVRDAMEQEP